MDQKFSDFSPEFWQAALHKRVLVVGNHDEELYRRAVAAYTAPGGVYEACFDLGTLPPKMMVYAGKELPESITPVDERGQFHIPMGGNDEAVRARIWSAYNAPYQSADPEERTAEGVRIEVSDQQRMDQDRSKDKPRGRNRANNRSRNPFEILELLDHSKCERLNTWGQLLDWAEFKKESPEAWQVFLNNRFSDKVLAQYAGTVDFTRPDERKVKDFPLWKDWLRSLRVMNGLSTVEMTELLGMSSRGSYNYIENSRDRSLSLERANFILSNNLFGLPEVEDESGNRGLDSAYAKKFVRMVGHKYYFPEEEKKQLFATVKALAQAYLHGEIMPEQMPSLNELMMVLSQDRLHKMIGGTEGSNIKTGIGIPHRHLSETSALYQLNGADFTAYFAAMPYYRKALQGNVASPALSPAQAFELAANTATRLGNFLKIYRESTGKTLKDVGSALGVTKQRIGQLERNTNHDQKFVDKILDQNNPYGLPVNEQGKIREDVAAFITGIHIPPRDSWCNMSKKEQQMIAQKAADEGKWCGFGEVAEVSAFLEGESTGRGVKLIYNPEYENLRKAWDKAIVDRATPIQPWQEGVLKIGEKEVRYKRGVDGEYRLHADGLQAVRAALQQNLSRE